MSERKGDWIQTASGISMFPLDPRVEEIRIEDIAHALANICRFTGHTRTFYSVAEHSVRVSWACPIEDAMWGLLHDASEAYLNDISKPMKRSSAYGPAYCEAEKNLMRVICVKFGLPPECPKSVKDADLRLLVTEKRDLMGPCDREWTQDIGLALPGRIVAKANEVAKDLFLNRFEQLRKIATPTVERVMLDAPTNAR